MSTEYEGTDIISYFHEVEIYHTVPAVYHIASAIYHFLREFEFIRKNVKNIFFVAHRHQKGKFRKKLAFFIALLPCERLKDYCSGHCRGCDSPSLSIPYLLKH